MADALEAGMEWTAVGSVAGTAAGAREGMRAGTEAACGPWIQVGPRAAQGLVAQMAAQGLVTQMAAQGLVAQVAVQGPVTQMAAQGLVVQLAAADLTSSACCTRSPSVRPCWLGRWKACRTGGRRAAAPGCSSRVRSGDGDKGGSR